MHSNGSAFSGLHVPWDSWRPVLPRETRQVGCETLVCDGEKDGGKALEKECRRSGSGGRFLVCEQERVF